MVWLEEEGEVDCEQQLQWRREGGGVCGCESRCSQRHQQLWW